MREREERTTERRVSRARGRRGGQRGTGERRQESLVLIALKLPPVQKHPLETCSHSSRQPRFVSSRFVLDSPRFARGENPCVMRNGRLSFSFSHRHLKTRSLMHENETVDSLSRFCYGKTKSRRIRYIDATCSEFVER